MASLHLKIITPKKIALEEDVDLVTVPSYEGEITILPHHTNLFSLLVEGLVKIKKISTSKSNTPEEEHLAIGGGYLETDGREVNILVSRAYGQDEIDEELTQKAIEEAKKIIQQTKDRKQRQEAISLLRRSVVDMKLVKRRKQRSI